MQDISFVGKLHSQCSFTLNFFHIFLFHFKILLTFLNMALARSRLGRKFCSLSQSHPIYFDYLLFLWNLLY